MADQQIANGFRLLLRQFAEKGETVVLLTPLTAPLKGKILLIADDYLRMSIVNRDENDITTFSSIFIPLNLIGGIEITDSVHNPHEGKNDEIPNSL